MAEKPVKAKTKVRPISLRYSCPPNGNQVGLSHYLMAETQRAK